MPSGTNLRLSGSPEETAAEAGRLARLAGNGLRFTVNGPLGAGKTMFVRGFVSELGYAGLVSSPTYVFLHEYQTPRGLFVHGDLYRLSDPEEIWAWGLEDYLAAPWLAIEWGERLSGLGDHLAVAIDPEGDLRRISGRARGPASSSLLDLWAAG